MRVSQLAKYDLSRVVWLLKHFKNIISTRSSRSVFAIFKAPGSGTRAIRRENCDSEACVVMLKFHLWYYFDNGITVSVARWHIFKQKTPIWVNFGGP
jgi:hypothetical protein